MVRLVRTQVRFAAVVGVLLLALGLPGVLRVATANAQGTAQRVVQGKVEDKANAPIKGAIVYLKDGHTLSVKSYISMDDGSFRFGQLTQNTDYELWAESGGKKSSVKTISSFDTKKEFDFRLTIDTGK
jgi:hypothetical protein